MGVSRRWPEAMPLVEVLWADIHSSGGWAPAERAKADASADGLLCRSVGYQLDSTPDTVVLAMSANSFGNVSDVMVIPRTNVRRVIVVAYPECSIWNDSLSPDNWRPPNKPGTPTPGGDLRPHPETATGR